MVYKLDAQFEKRFEEFKDRNEEDLRQIKIKLDALWDFRAYLLGASFIISGICSLFVTAVVLFFENKH